MAQFTPDRQTLRHLAAGRSWREIGSNVARRLGVVDRSRALSAKYARFDRGDTESLYTDADELRALAAELAAEVDDLGGAVLWTFRDVDGRLVTLGLALPLFSAVEAAYEARGWFSGANQSSLIAAEVVPTFASERERWLAENMPDLGDAERAYVLAVDPTERHLRAVWLVHRAATFRTDEARRDVVAWMREFAASGKLGDLDLDAIAELAHRRLKLLDVPTGVHAQWKREHRNLAATQRIALDVDLDRLRAQAS